MNVFMIMHLYFLAGELVITVKEAKNRSFQREVEKENAVDPNIVKLLSFMSCWKLCNFFIKSKDLLLIA